MLTVRVICDLTLRMLVGMEDDSIIISENFHGYVNPLDWSMDRVITVYLIDGRQYEIKREFLVLA